MSDGDVTGQNGPQQCQQQNNHARCKPTVGMQPTTHTSSPMLRAAAVQLAGSLLPVNMTMHCPTLLAWLLSWSREEPLQSFTTKRTLAPSCLAAALVRGAESGSSCPALMTAMRPAACRCTNSHSRSSPSKNGSRWCVGPVPAPCCSPAAASASCSPLPSVKPQTLSPARLRATGQFSNSEGM